MQVEDRLQFAAGLMAGLAHDLANHLGVLATSVHLARSSPEKHLPRMEEHIQKAQALLRTVMGVVRGEAPTMTPEPASELMAEAASSLGAPTSVVALEREIGVRCQRTLVIQSLMNLLSNAADAAGPGGQVQLSCALSPDGRSARFHVADDGPGFPDQFDATAALNSSKTNGTGLGLVVVRCTALLHGGGVEFRRVGGRTIVELTLPTG